MPALAAAPAPVENIFASCLAGPPNVRIDGLAGLVRQFELYRAPCFPLADRSTVESVAVRRDIGDFDRHDIAATQFTVDRQVEQGEVARFASELKVRSDGPDMLIPAPAKRDSRKALPAGVVS
jgi:hypothetical protein